MAGSDSLSPTSGDTPLSERVPAMDGSTQPQVENVTDGSLDFTVEAKTFDDTTQLESMPPNVESSIDDTDNPDDLGNEEHASGGSDSESDSGLSEGDGSESRSECTTDSEDEGGSDDDSQRPEDENTTCGIPNCCWSDRWQWGREKFCDPHSEEGVFKWLAQAAREKRDSYSYLSPTPSPSGSPKTLPDVLPFSSTLSPELWRMVAEFSDVYVLYQFTRTNRLLRHASLDAWEKRIIVEQSNNIRDAHRKLYEEARSNILAHSENPETIRLEEDDQFGLPQCDLNIQPDKLWYEWGADKAMFWCVKNVAEFFEVAGIDESSVVAWCDSVRYPGSGRYPGCTVLNHDALQESLSRHDASVRYSRFMWISRDRDVSVTSKLYLSGNTERFGGRYRYAHYFGVTGERTKTIALEKYFGENARHEGMSFGDREWI